MPSFERRLAERPGGTVATGGTVIITFGGVLGLSAFTTYNWLTQFDTVEGYLVYPVAIEDVFRAKRIAFLLVSAPTVALPYLVAVVRFDASALDAPAGAVGLALSPRAGPRWARRYCG